jgi:hypothetical protein
MALFANVADGTVLEVIVVADEALAGLEFPASEKPGQAFLAELGLTGTWLQADADGAFRGCYPGPGYTWTPDKKRKDGGTFAPPQVTP